MRAILLAIGAGLCWGVGELFTRSVLHTKSVGPITAIAVRSTVALPILWGAYVLAVHVMKVEPRTWTRAEPVVLLRLVLGSGLIAGAGGMLFFYAALNVGEASRVKPIAFTVAPAIAALLAWFFLREPMPTRKLVGIALILAGVAFLTGAPKPAPSPTPSHAPPGQAT